MLIFFTPTLRDWTEDFPHENGQYECMCGECGQKFHGHKRRAICRLCALDVIDQPQELVRE